MQLCPLTNFHHPLCRLYWDPAGVPGFGTFESPAQDGQMLTSSPTVVYVGSGSPTQNPMVAFISTGIVSSFPLRDENISRTAHPRKNASHWIPGPEPCGKPCITRRQSVQTRGDALSAISRPDHSCVAEHLTGSQGADHSQLSATCVRGAVRLGQRRLGAGCQRVVISAIRMRPCAFAPGLDGLSRSEREGRQQGRKMSSLPGVPRPSAGGQGLICVLPPFPPRRRRGAPV